MSASGDSTMGRMAQRLLLLSAMMRSVFADSALIFPQAVPSWAEASMMEIEVTEPGHSGNITTYQVLPLTQGAGLNQSQLARKQTWILGNLTSVTSLNYNQINASDAIAYLSCDNTTTTTAFLQNLPNMVVNALMNKRPKAILLYSLSENSCGLSGSNLAYESLFTMTSKKEASQVLNMTTSTSGTILSAIDGSQGSTDSTGTSSDDDDSGGNNPAVAMSILYSITGLITLLFLIIIATGAVRAHRYPERYGPRSGDGGGPRQSRARGLARAVLETLPIVKFGQPIPAKPDPALELEAQPTHTAAHDAAVASALSTAPGAAVSGQQANSRKAPDLADPGRGSAVDAPERFDALAAVDRAGNQDQDGVVPVESGSGQHDENLECSICTEIFTVGEDVRVLPCDHKFHPQCVDPWLVNVSGTCPLCRLDLRPRDEQGGNANSQELPPPLEVDGMEREATATLNTQRNSGRGSRILDFHRLVHASVEERIEILRSHRTQQRENLTAPVVAEPDLEERSHSAGLAERLRERFRIRTRTQSPTQTQSVSG